MFTHTQWQRPLLTYVTTFAVAALAIGALAAALLAGGAPASATNEAPAPVGGNLLPMPQEDEPTPTPKPTPQQTDPEACSDTPARVVSRGHYAIFDVYWNGDDKNLFINPCPPGATHNADETTTRAASNIDIGRTIMHVSGGSNLSPRTNSLEDYLKWPFLYPNASDNPQQGSDVGAPYSSNIWALHDCSHDANPPPAEDDLCMGVSAGLLRASDWAHIDYEMESVREPAIAPADRGQVFVFLKYDDVPEGGKQVLWSSDDAADTGIDIDPGEYVHPRWAFTQPGTYQFQVHVNGVPNPSFLRAESLTTIVRTYTVHVGDLSDLGVTVAASHAAPDVEDDVTFTVTATNHGPDTAGDAEANVTLPAGLTYKSSSTATGSYNSTTGIWSVGDLANGASATLSITAAVGDNTHGQSLTVTAAIKAHETIGSSTVVELDPQEGNNTADVTITPVRAGNVNPAFTVMCSVNEFASAGTKVCDPVTVKDPDTGDTLTYGLTGDGANYFAVQSVDGGAKVVVAQGANLQQAAGQSYALALTVSDGKDSNGNVDPSVDDSIAVMIEVLDFTVSLTPSSTSVPVGQSVTFTVTVENSPVPVSQLWHTWFEQESRVGSQPDESTGQGNPGTLTESRSIAGDWVFNITFFYLEGGQKKAVTSSGETSVRWHN